MMALIDLKGPQQKIVVRGSVCPSLHFHIHQVRPPLPGSRDMLYQVLKFVYQVTEGEEISKTISVPAHAAQPVLPHDSFLTSVIMTNMGVEFTQKNFDVFHW